MPSLFLVASPLKLGALGGSLILLPPHPWEQCLCHLPTTLQEVLQKPKSVLSLNTVVEDEVAEGVCGMGVNMGLKSHIVHDAEVN